MEKFSIEFSKKEIQKIKRFIHKDESFESAIKRLTLSYIPDITRNEWSDNIDKIFDEFEETFQKLAE